MNIGIDNAVEIAISLFCFGTGIRMMIRSRRAETDLFQELEQAISKLKQVTQACLPLGDKENQPNDEWQKFTASISLPVCRTGWAGVWDALVAAVSRRRRLTVVVPAEITFYAKPRSDGGSDAFGLQMSSRYFHGSAEI